MTTSQNRLYIIFSLSLIAVLLFSACAPGATGQPPVTQAPADTEVPATTEVPVYTEVPAVTEQSAETIKCEGEENSSLYCTFSQVNEMGEVYVDLPWQGRRLNIEERPFVEDLGTPPPQNGFNIVRPIINIEVIDPNDNSIVRDFDPPLIITAQYTTDDWEAWGIQAEQLFIAVLNTDTWTFQTYDSRKNPDLDTSIDPSPSTGTIEVKHWTSQTYWAAPGWLTRIFVQEDDLSEVTIDLPWQGIQLEIVERGFSEDLDPLITFPEYIREIKYLQVIDPSDGSVVHDFAPPLVMTAEYTDGDVEAVSGELDQLLIGIYDHDLYEFKEYAPEFDTSALTGRIWIEHWTSHACWIRPR